MKKSLLQIFAVLAIGLFGMSRMNAQATLSVQGTIQKSTGIAVDDGDYAITFKLYTTDAGGTPIWSETQDPVEIIGGVYSVALGSVNPLNVPFDQPYFLGIAVGTGAEHTPRTPLTASPYALSLLGQDNKFPSTGMVKMSAMATGTDITTATSYTVADDDQVVYLDHTANQNVTLPAATTANTGRKLMLVNKAGVAKTLTSSNYVDLAGGTSTIVPATGAVELQSDGSVWRQTGGYVTPTVAPTKVFVRCTTASNFTLLASQTPKIPFTTYLNIGGNHFNNSTNTFTAPRTGIYTISGGFFGSAGSGAVGFGLAGCSVCNQIVTSEYSLTGVLSHNFGYPVHMNAGDTFYVYGYANNSSTVNAGSWLHIAEN